MIKLIQDQQDKQGIKRRTCQEMLDDAHILIHSLKRAIIVMSTLASGLKNNKLYSGLTLRVETSCIFEQHQQLEPNLQEVII